MQKLHLKATKNTPEFNYDVENFTITISGSSEVEKSNPFYSSINQVLTTVEQTKPIRLNIVFNLHHICRNSKRGLLFFLMRLKEVQVNCRTDIRINWNYSNKNNLVKVIGEDLEYMTHMPVNFRIMNSTPELKEELAASF